MLQALINAYKQLESICNELGSDQRVMLNLVNDYRGRSYNRSLQDAIDYATYELSSLYGLTDTHRALVAVQLFVIVNVTA